MDNRLIQHSMDHDRSKGYLRQSALYQARPDLASFRCFASLNALVLLQQQAEIVDLEARLLADIQADREDEDVELQELEVNFASACRERSDTHDKLLKLRKALEEYNKGILAFKHVYSLPRMEKSAFDTLRYWFHAPRAGDNFLQGFERLIWEPETSFDLVKPLEAKEKQDVASRYIDEILIPLANEKILGRKKSNLKVYDPLTRSLQEEPLRYYSDSAIALAVDMASVIAAYLLTVAPIFALYYVEKRGAKIAIVATFALTFCVAMTLLTTARRAEHFLALAAFTAVLIVFVSNDYSALTVGS